MGCTAADLTAFFAALETNFPLSGVRAALSEKIGGETTAALERTGLIAFLRQSDTYPCPSPGGTGCPRQVIHHSDGARITAVCGNDPPECCDLDLTKKDIEILSVVPQRLCEALRGMLLFGGKTESTLGLEQVFHAGTFQPRPGVRKAVYFAARCSPRAYANLLDVLRSRHGSDGFGLLVPTDRFVSDDTIRESATQGIVVLPLADVIGMDVSGRLVAKVGAGELLAGIGRMGPGPIVPGGTVFAQVVTRAGWENLDEAGYRELLRNLDRYDIIADEHTKEVFKRAVEKRSGNKEKRTTSPVRVSAGYFQVIRNAVETRGYFDPTVAEEKDSGKQTFQRARQAFDVKKMGPDGNSRWTLFKTVKVDNHSAYQFQPDEGVTFALIFLPKA